MIRAECHSDDGCFRVEFDAAAWFAEAGDDEIVAIAKCGWRDDYPTDQIAIDTALTNPTVELMFKYIEIRSNAEPIGFSCSVNSDDAVKWIRDNRSHLLEEVFGE